MINRTSKMILVVFTLSLMILTNGITSDNAYADKEKMSVYDRVIKSRTIRAAYITYPPACIKDTVSGKLTGTFVETLEEIAKNLDLKVVWTEEVGWGDQIAGLMADRYDIVGSPVWANPTRGKLTQMSVPLYYSGIGIYVRNDEERFTDDRNKINSKKVKIVTIDGETGDLIARSLFPEAKRVSLPQLTDISRMFLEITTNKGDVAFAEPYYGYKFLKSYPDSIKNIAAAKPIKVLGNCYMFKRNQIEFKHMIDVAIEDLQNSGFVDKIIDKYEPFPNTFYRVALPYRTK